jgi:hypothetical protein
MMVLNCLRDEICPTFNPVCPLLDLFAPAHPLLVFPLRSRRSLGLSRDKQPRFITTHLHVKRSNAEAAGSSVYVSAGRVNPSAQASEQRIPYLLRPADAEMSELPRQLTTA